MLALWGGVAHAATVLVMGPGGHVSTRQDPFVPAARADAGTERDPGHRRGRHRPPG